MRFKGGKAPWFELYEPVEKQIVIISLVVKPTLGADFAFGSRWALMQYHAWTDRRHFLDMSDEEAKTYFLKWVHSSECPWCIVDEYLTDNNLKRRAGAGPSEKQKATATSSHGADTGEEGHEKEGATEDEQEHYSETEVDSESDAEKEQNRDTHVLRMLYAGNSVEASRYEECARKAKVYNEKHSYYRYTRCTSVAQEESSALPGGVFNVNEDSDDDEAYYGEQKEIQKEMDELRAVQHWVNQEGWDLSVEARALSPKTVKEVDLRLDWGDVKKRLGKGADADVDAAPARVDRDALARDYSLEALDPTQRAFANRVLKWVSEVVEIYKKVSATGKPQRVPLLRTWLCGSAGSGKSTTLKAIVQHARVIFEDEGLADETTISLIAYTGVAAFNMGFGAKTACSALQVFPNAAWKNELTGAAYRKLERDFGNVVLLIPDEVSFIGRAFLARMHHRLQQAKRRFFAEAGIDANNCTLGDVSIILVGDFGQLEPIDDWSMCDTEARYKDQPKRLLHLWRHANQGEELVKEIKEAIMLKNIHRSKDDLWWTESCLRLRDFTCTMYDDYNWWREHDLDRGHFNKEQKKYFEDHAVWLGGRCEDVGVRNGRKLARMAEDNKEIVHQIHARHSIKSAKKHSSNAFGGLRPVVNAVRGCKMVLTRNVAYLYGLANGTRGQLVGVVYAADAAQGAFPEALVLDVPDYTGPVFYPDEPTWVPIIPSTSLKEGTRMTRTQFPVAAGFAMTVNKAQGLTIKEGVAIRLKGSPRFRPAGKHGLPFVAFTRSESFAMTAFKNLPPWHDFLKGRDSEMLRMRKNFTERLDKMHVRTLAEHSDMKTEGEEAAAQENWKAEQEAKPKRRKHTGP